MKCQVLVENACTHAAPLWGPVHGAGGRGGGRAVTRTNVNYTYQPCAAASFHPHVERITHALSSWKFPINSAQTRTIHDGFLSPAVSIIFITSSLGEAAPTSPHTTSATTTFNRLNCGCREQCFLI